MTPAVIGQQVEETADKPDHGRINLDDVGGRAGVKPAGHCINKDEDRNDDQGRDIIHFKYNGHDPGRTGKVAGHQDGKTECHQKRDDDLGKPVISPEIKIRQCQQVHPVQGFGKK